MSALFLEMPPGCAGAIDFGPDIDFNNPPPADAEPALITWSISTEGGTLTEGEAVPSRNLPRLVIQIDPELITDSWTLPLEGAIEYSNLEGAVIGRVEIDLDVEVAVRADVDVDLNAYSIVSEDDPVLAVAATITRTDPGLGRAAVITVETTNCRVVSGGVGNEAGRTVVYRGDLDEPVDVAFTIEADPACYFVVLVSGEATSERLGAGRYVSIEPAAPSEPRIESSTCDDVRCTIVFSAVSNSEVNELVQVTGLADEEFSTYGTNGIWVYPLPAAEPGDRITYAPYETLPVDTFCFSAQTATRRGFVPASSETQCADLVNGSYVQRDPDDPQAPLARPDAASAAVAETVSVGWAANDRLVAAELSSVIEGDLLGGTIAIDAQQLLFTAGRPGMATFDYTICDPSEQCSTATVSIEVVPCSLPPLTYYWDELGLADPGTATARVGDFVDCDGHAITAFRNETLSGSVGFADAVYGEAQSVDANHFRSSMSMSGVPTGLNETVAFEGWYRYELPDGTVMGRGTFSDLVEVPVPVAAAAELDRSVLIEGQEEALLTLTGSLPAGISSRVVFVYMRGCSAHEVLEEDFLGQLVFHQRVQSTFTIEIPVENGPCAPSFLIGADGASTARPFSGGSFRLDFFYSAPEIVHAPTTSCVDAMCEVSFSVTQRSRFLSDILVLGWSSDRSEWNTRTVHNTPGIALEGETIQVTATFAETQSFCAATVADHHSFSPRLDRMGDLFCAELVDGVYIERPASEEELALYPR